MPTTQLITFIQMRVRRIADWFRDQAQLNWLDSLGTEYRDWKPEGPIYERLIR